MEPDSLSSTPRTPTSPWEWEVTKDHKPKDESVYNEAIKYLLNNDEWVQNPERVKQVVTLLDNTESSEKINSVYNKLFKSNLMVKIHLPEGGQKNILKENLSEQSKFFNKLLSSGMQETKLSSISLKNENVEPSVVNSFIDYISSGECKISNDNVLPMLSLCSKYDIPKLETICLQHIRNALDLDSFIDIFDSAIRLQHDDLCWMCLDFAATNMYRIEGLLKKQTADNPINPRIIALINKVKQFDENLIKFKRDYSSTMDPIPSIRVLSCTNPAPWKLLDEMNELLPVTRLQLVGNKGMILSEGFEDNRNFDLLLKFIEKHPNLHSLNLEKSLDINDEKLNEIGKNLTQIHTFRISEAPITRIPDNIAKQVKALQCKKCEKITNLDLPQVEDLNCFECIALYNLSAPKAREINCSCCPALPFLEAPKAIIIDCLSCASLGRIIAPLAKWINCQDCKELFEIYASSLETLMIEERRSEVRIHHGPKKPE